MKTVAIIVAAGKGKRMKHKTPKQFLKVKGKPLLFYTLSVFEDSKDIDQIVLVVNEDKRDYSRKLIKQSGFKKLSEVVSGGPARAYSIQNGMKSLPDGTSIVVIHDGIRPFITSKVIKRVVRKAKKENTAVAAMEMKSTIKTVKNNQLEAAIDRRNVVKIQTPQAFKLEILKDSYEKGEDILSIATDTSSIVKAAGYKVNVVKGDSRNIKITTQEDLESARLTLMGYYSRMGLGYDIHSLVKGRKLFIGGVEIPFEKGLQGHSDADVLLHAVTDAIFGALGNRDIGYHFSDRDDRFKDMNSRYFIERAYTMLKKENYRIINIDTVVVAQEPKLQPYRTNMIGNLSNWLEIKKSSISIKFCSPEGLGHLGNKKGIASLAMIMINK